MRQKTFSPEKHMPSKVPSPAIILRHTHASRVSHPPWPDPIFVQAIAHVTAGLAETSDRRDTARDRDLMSPGPNLKYFK